MTTYRKCVIREGVFGLKASGALPGDDKINLCGSRWGEVGLSRSMQ